MTEMLNLSIGALTFVIPTRTRRFDIADSRNNATLVQVHSDKTADLESLPDCPYRSSFVPGILKLCSNREESGRITEFVHIIISLWN